MTCDCGKLMSARIHVATRQSQRPVRLNSFQVRAHRHAIASSRHRLSARAPDPRRRRSRADVAPPHARSVTKCSVILYNMPDASGPVATGRDNSYALTIDQAADLYARAGHPRTARSIQRYCASGHLDAVKETTMLGDKYFINAGSVSRHIAQIEELIALDNRSTGRGLSRPAATENTAPNLSDSARQDTTVSPPVAVAVATDRPANPEPDHGRQTPTPPADASRPDATEAGLVSRHVALLEREVERLTEDKIFLRDQVKTKDEQIAALLERDRETNFLVQGLQKMLAPLLGGGRREPPEPSHAEH